MKNTTGEDQKGGHHQINSQSSFEYSPVKSEKLSPAGHAPSINLHQCDPEDTNPYQDSKLVPEKKSQKLAPPGISVAHVPETPNLTGRTGSSVEAF